MLRLLRTRSASKRHAGTARALLRAALLLLACAPVMHAAGWGPIRWRTPERTPAIAAASTDAAHGILFRVLPPETDASPAADAAGGAPASQARTDSYLFGTIHIGGDQALGLDPVRLASALASTRTLVNEIDAGVAADAALDGYRWLPADQTLSALIGADGVAMARALLPQVPPQALERMKPWLVLALLEAQGHDAASTLDERLQRMALARGMRVEHLETPEDQLRALDCVPSQAMALVLQDRLRAPWIVHAMSLRAIAHYRARDLGAWLADVEDMLGLDVAGKEIETRARRCLIEDRNRRWLPTLMALLDEGGCYVAVGALHLPGEHGLLASLARAGYRIEVQDL